VSEAKSTPPREGLAIPPVFRTLDEEKSLLANEVGGALRTSLSKPQATT
jgi:hypothetical protein